jgi:hypothetical protein
MKRRNFLQLLGALAGVPFLPRTAAKPAAAVTGQNSVVGRRIIPVGAVQPYAGQIVPDGWLPCDGRAMSRLEHKPLFSVLGTIYGEGDGTRTFNVPDMIPRYPYGIKDPGHQHGREIFAQQYIIKAKA